MTEISGKHKQKHIIDDSENSCQDERPEGLMHLTSRNLLGRKASKISMSHSRNDSV